MCPTGDRCYSRCVCDERPELTNQAAVYGRCIVVDYNAVHKDKCAAEFMKLKDCYLVSQYPESLWAYWPCWPR